MPRSRLAAAPSIIDAQKARKRRALDAQFRRDMGALHEQRDRGRQDGETLARRPDILGFLAAGVRNPHFGKRRRGRPRTLRPGISILGGPPIKRQGGQQRYDIQWKRGIVWWVDARRAPRKRSTRHGRKIDLDGKTWTIPGHRMKAGIEHRVPLSERAVEILERAKALGTSAPYVFPGRKERRPLSDMALLMCLRRMQRSDLTTHGFRSSFRDWSAERTNVPRAVCEAALAHKLRDKTEAAYNRTDLFERRRDLMASWSAFATAKPADVVAIRA